MAGSMTVHGREETAAAFDEFARDVADMTTIHETVIRARLPGVSRRTPVRTGTLQASWDVTADATAGTIGSDVSYAPPVEYGVPGRGIEPARMVAATLEDEQDLIVREYEDALRERARAAGFRVE